VDFWHEKCTPPRANFQAQTQKVIHTLRITFSFKGLTFLRISGILFVMKMKNAMTTYGATYLNNYPRVNGRQVFDTDEGTKLTLSKGDDFKGNYTVIKWHSYDDYGQTLETVTVKNDIWGSNPVEIYSTDEGETFTFSCE